MRLIQNGVYMKKYCLTPLFKAFSLSFFLIFGLSHNILQAAERAPSEGAVWFCLGLGNGIAQSTGLNPLAAQSLVLSTYQYRFNQDHGIRTLLKHFTRNALLLQFFEAVRTIINEDPFFSDESLTMGHSAVFKDIATIVAFSIALNQYLSSNMLKDTVLYVKDMGVDGVKNVYKIATEGPKFLFNRLMIMNTKKRLVCLGLSITFGSLLVFIPIPTMPSIFRGLCETTSYYAKEYVGNRVLSQLGLPNNRLDMDIESVTRWPKKFLDKGIEQVRLHKREIKLITYKILYFLTEQLRSQFLEPMAAICSR